MNSSLQALPNSPDSKKLTPAQARARLNIAPRALFVKDYKLGLLWSAKAGCTFATKWFFYQTGLLNTAQFYSSWIHYFRGDVFYKSEGYKEGLEAILEPDARVIKIVRNPYSRLVSAYLAYCQATQNDLNPSNQAVVSAIAQFLERPINQDSTFSFREFVAYLESIDLQKCNIHFRLQVHPLEPLLHQLFVVKLENSAVELAQLEQQLGLLTSDTARLSQSSHHRNKRSDSAEFCGDRQFGQTSNMQLPAARFFYDNELQQKVAQLYRLDFEQYCYDIDQP